MFLELQIFRRGPQFHCRSRTSPSAETSNLYSPSFAPTFVQGAGLRFQNARVSLASQQETILLVVKQALVRLPRELSTATDQVPVGGRFGFSENLGRPTALLSEGCAIYLQPRCIWLGYESDRFAHDSACRNPIILFLPEHQTLTVAMVHIVA